MAQKRFFTAELNSRREELWVESKLRLKAVVHDAVDTLTDDLRSSDEKIAIMSAIHVLKAAGIYGELNQNFGPDTSVEAAWRQAKEKKLHTYSALMPDSFCDWSVKNQMEKLSEESAAEMIRFWYEQAVDEQKKELRGYKKRTKIQPQLPQVEPIPPTTEAITEDPQQEKLELIDA